VDVPLLVLHGTADEVTSQLASGFSYISSLLTGLQALYGMDWVGVHTATQRLVA
jgi:hypothetical protein